MSIKRYGLSLLLTIILAGCANYVELPHAVSLERNPEMGRQGYGYVIQMVAHAHIRHNIHTMDFFGAEVVSSTPLKVYLRHPFGINKDDDIALFTSEYVPVRGLVIIEKEEVSINVEYCFDITDKNGKRIWREFMANGKYSLIKNELTHQP